MEGPRLFLAGVIALVALGLAVVAHVDGARHIGASANFAMAFAGLLYAFSLMLGLLVLYRLPEVIGEGA